MNVQPLRIRLIEKGLRVKDLARLADIDYDRLQKVLHGYRPPRPEEIRAISEALEVPQSTLAAWLDDRHRVNRADHDAESHQP